LLYDLCARGMLLKFYDDNSLTMDVIPLVTSSYSPLTRSFKFTQDCTDLYYFKCYFADNQHIFNWVSTLNSHY